MLKSIDPRAWAILIVLLVIATGAGVIWVRRPHAKIPRGLRSATAPSSNHASDATSPVETVKIDGCDRAYLIRPGALLEPRVLPGFGRDQFLKAYGKESEGDKLGPLTWKRYEYSLTEEDLGRGKAAARVGVTINQGHVLKTLDGIELGFDTFAVVLRKMRDRGIAVQETIKNNDAHDWTLTAAFYSVCSGKFRSEYRWSVQASPEVDRKIQPQATDATGHPGALRSALFMNRVVYDYDLVMSNGSDQPVDGEPSEHN